MYRFLSWMAIGIAAAFLVVATAAFSLPVIKWLAFAIGFGTLIVSGSIRFSYRTHVPTVLTALATALVSAWVFLTWPHFRPAFTLDSLGKLLILAALANLCYSAAYLIDIPMQQSPSGAAWRQRRWKARSRRWKTSTITPTRME